MDLRVAAAALGLALAVSGCATSRVEQDAFDDYAQQRDAVAEYMAYAAQKRADLPYVGSKLIKRKPEYKLLPDVFSQLITIGNAKPMTLPEIAQSITALTRIPVNISPDLFASQQSGAPEASSETGSPATPVPAAPAIGATEGVTGVGALPLRMTVAFTGPLSDFLDHVASRMGIAWEYRNGAINFSRYVTRVYVLNMYPGKSSQRASVGKSGAGGGGAVGGGEQGLATGGGSPFSASSASDFSSEFDPWSAVEAALKSLTTKGGKYSISPATGIIVVTDTKDAQDRVASYLKTLEKIMSLQITLKVSVISADAGSNNQAGIDWNLVWNRLAQIAPNYGLTVRGIPIPSTLNTNGGGIGLAVLQPIGGGTSKWDGSTAVFRALNSVTRATMVTDNIWHTLNRQPLSVAIADQTGYASTSTQQSTDSGNPIASTSVSIITTGFILNITPSTTDGKEITLQFSMDISTPPTIETFGEVQVPKYSSKQIAQRAKLRAGETLVLSGFSLRDRNYSKSGLFSPDEPLFIGGNRDDKVRRQDLVVLITPIVED